MNTFWKRRSLIIIGSAFFFCSPVALINYIVDPLWCFQHNVPIGRYQTAFDERQQKTDYLAFRKTNIDTVIFGNSRVTYMDVLPVPGKAFNYAASSLSPKEFLPYLQFAASRSTSPIKTVILGLSFGDSNARIKSSFISPIDYIEKTTSLGFRFRSLVDLNLLRYSIASIRRELQGNYHDAYVREGEEISAKRMILPVPPDMQKKEIEENLDVYRTIVYGKDYVYYDNRKELLELKKRFPTTRFIVYITPVSAHLLKLLLEQGLFDCYAQWIKDTVEVFGEIWNFMYFNDITLNDNNYKDAHHCSPKICDIITYKIFDMLENNYDIKFGIKITRENLDEQLKFIRKNMSLQY